MIWTILLFVAVLSVLVVAHEWGHYFAAKKMGVAVEEFGLGFPPRIFGWKGKDGMLWTLNLIPLGGFVKIKGEGFEDRDDPNSFAKKSVPARLLILLAGVGMNLVTAAVLLSIGFSLGLPTYIEEGVPAGATVRDQAITIAEVLPGSPAEQSGLIAGDNFISIDGVVMTSAQGTRDTLANPSDSGTLDVIVDRQGSSIEVTVIPAYIKEIDHLGVGAAVIQTGTVSYPWYLAPVKGVEATYSYTMAVGFGLYDMIAGLVTGQGMGADVSGPIGIAKMTGQVAAMGFVYLLQFAALLSINLAVLNVFPFPALDGGRAAFVLLEVIRRKQASPKVEAIVHNLGFAVLMLLVIAVTYRDIINLF